ncbi:Tad domain-containing protein [Defluviimonas sp. WL0050]|uniref:Tad domain-containing protein n=1 Tax=Albidovulum litorale TaxID=2984134 RepID=A0ABT2ZIM4_9RHOB|nr:Tad domain-containing protein [Defluviimonas sp. WL0050]MCV2870873.1 Tad domain-containing protein [Defluviimonas sp. WL0050]
MKIRTQLRSFTRREDGTILVFWAMALAMVLGLVALSFDIGRLAATQSELQSFADHVALTAAGELDGKSDSITRATAAAANLIADTQTFGSGSRALAGSADYTLDFYATLPASDASPLVLPSPNPSPPSPENAVYAQVIVNPKSVGFAFGSVISTFLGGGNLSPSTNAVAVAGFTQYACDVAPMMFCIPDPSFDASDPARVGDMIRLRSGGQGAAWGPGNFGFLQPSTLALDSTGACAGISGTGPQLSCILGAAGSITQCFPQKGVNTEPGQKVGITSAMNYRFDMFPNSTHGPGKEMNDPRFAPAPNVVKGIQPNGGGCGWQGQLDPTDAMALPRDTCFPGCAPYGNGSWDSATYETTNHPSVASGTLTGMTRYQTYLWELTNAGGFAIPPNSPVSNPILPSKTVETGRAQCSPWQSDPDRRVIIIAGVNCDPTQGGVSISGSATNVPVHQFVKMFITEPIVQNGSGGTTSLDIYAEIIGSAEVPGSNGTAGVIHDVVQLFR